jgi:hypothetical protein
MSRRSGAGGSADIPPVVTGSVWFHRQVPAVFRRLQAKVDVLGRSLANGSSNGSPNGRDRGGWRSLIRQGLRNGPPPDGSLPGRPVLSKVSVASAKCPT